MIILSQVIAGVAPDTPGWGTYHVLPKEAFLTTIHVVMPSIKGAVTVDIKKTATAYALCLTSPANTTASVPDAAYLFSGHKYPVDASAANALDGDHWTGWRDMTRPQYPGQWFQVDMQQAQTFNQIVLENTWALWDSPFELDVYHRG